MLLLLLLRCIQVPVRQNNKVLGGHYLLSCQNFDFQRRICCPKRKNAAPPYKTGKTTLRIIPFILKPFRSRLPFGFARDKPFRTGVLDRFKGKEAGFRGTAISSCGRMQCAPTNKFTDVRSKNLRMVLLHFDNPSIRVSGQVALRHTVTRAVPFR